MKPKSLRAKLRASNARSTPSHGFLSDELPLRGQRIPTKTGFLAVSELQFYADNPRVYSLVHGDDGEPTQSDIERKLLEQEHVKALVHDIKSHGGLIEPIVVRDGTLDVLEGNSRLAAYRHLAKKDPAKWSRVKCTIVPEDISDSLISALLSQLHLKGKKEWPPYEQAGHIYRRHARHNVAVEELAVETGLTRSVLSKTIEAYQLMVNHKDDTRDMWSYYLEFVKSKTIAKARKAYDGLDALVIKKFRSSEVKTAQALRDHLPVICRSQRVLKRFAEGKLKFEEAYEDARAGGADNREVARLQKFRQWLAKAQIRAGFSRASGAVRAKVRFEVSRIRKLATELENELG